MHPVVEILILVVVLVLALWIIESWMLPQDMPPRPRWILRFVIGFFALLWLFDVVGVINVLGCHGGDARRGRGDVVLDGR